MKAREPCGSLCPPTYSVPTVEAEPWEWTLDQVDRDARAGRATYGDRQTTGALTWLRTGQENQYGEYGLIYVETNLDYLVFAHYHTQYTETFKAFGGAGEGRIGDQRVDIELGKDYVVPPRVVHGWVR